MASNGNNRRPTAERLGRRRAVRRPARRRGMPLWLKLTAALASIGFLVLIGLFGAGIAVYKNYTNELLAPDELAINKPSYGAKILDRNGKLLYEYVDDQSGLRRPVRLQDISPAFLAATISTEDDSFFSNPG